MLNDFALDDQAHRGWINTKEPRELIYWMDYLHADADMLKDAINAVGPSEDLVREHLNQTRLH